MADLEQRYLLQTSSNRVELAAVDIMAIPFPKWKLCLYKVEEEKENNFVTSNSNYEVSAVDRLYIPFSKMKLCCPQVDENIYRITVPYDIPIQDTQKHKVRKDLPECVVTGQNSKVLELE